MLNAGTKIVKEIDQSCLISKTVGQVACPGVYGRASGSFTLAGDRKESFACLVRIMLCAATQGL